MCMEIVILIVLTFYVLISNKAEINLTYLASVVKESLTL